jgi:hypothetical protein
MKNDDDQAFDGRMRAALRSLPVPARRPSPFRERGRRWTRGAAWFSATALCASVVAIVLFSPPRLVNQAWEHVAEETSLRGNFLPDTAKINASLGLAASQSLPGYVQLAKLCQVAGHDAYHVTTFVDGKGWVTILSFKSGIAGAKGQGQWMGRHWAFMDVKTERTVLLLSDDRKALQDVEHYLST